MYLSMPILGMKACSLARRFVQDLFGIKQQIHWEQVNEISKTVFRAIA